MKMYKKIIALTVMLFGMTGWAGDSASFLLDTTDQLVATGVEVSFSYNSSWIGDDPSAEVVISADGTEVNRTTGVGEFAWSPAASGKHTLTYTTHIDGVAQEEVYTATVYADWKYTKEDGKATIVEASLKTGDVVIPSEIDGCPVVGLDDSLFKGCEGLTSITIPPGVTMIGYNAFANCSGLKKVSMPMFLKSQVEKKNVFDGCAETLDIDYRTVEIWNVVVKQRRPWNGKVDISFVVTENFVPELSNVNKLVLSVTAMDRKTGSDYVAQASALSGDTGTAQGEHHIVWDLNAQGLEIKSDDVVFTVSYSISF